MKLIIMPRGIKDINNTLKYADAYMLGVSDLSVNMPNYFDMDELIKIINYLNENNKEIFISLNKNMHNNDLDYLKDVLQKLSVLKINGVLFYDMAVVNINKNSDLKLPLVWGQEHLTNNVLTSNFWYEHGAKYTLISGEITKEEVDEIKDLGQAKMILPIFGHLPMFVSMRHLVRNYLDTFNINDNSQIYYLEHEKQLYPVIDTRDGTIAYSSKILNGISEVPNLKVDYILLDSFLIDEDVFTNIVKMYSEVNPTNKEEYNEIINNLLDTDYGFLYKETIYKVKKNV